MANQELRLKVRGLYTNPNTFSEAPEGSLSTADNVVLDRESIVASRRGFKQYGVPFSMTALASSIFSFNSRLLVHATNDKIYYDANNNGAVWTAFTGNYPVPTTDPSDRLYTAQANKNLYFTSRNGIYKMTSSTVEPILAGAPQALGGSGSTTGASGFMTNNTNVAYRIVWGYRDANENLILGAPSDRIIVSNSSGTTANVNLTFLVPDGIVVGYFYQIYRSGESASLADQPNDELQQVFEANVTSGDITAGQITVLDSTPNDLRQATLYTSPSQEGIENANYQPPFAKDIVAYKQYMWYGNTRSLQRYFLTLIAVDGTDGIQVGDTITFTNILTPTPVSFTLTAAAAEDPALGEFEVFTTGSPSENIENTSRSIINILNRYTANTFLSGYYTSGFDELPGQMQFDKNSLDPNTFAVTSSRTTCWSPQIPTSGTNTVNISNNEARVNRVYYSKFQQPEAVPLYRYFDIGSADQPIEHMVALRDGIIVMKTDGVFRISGDTDASFRVALLDNTVRIIAPNSAAVLANQVYFFSTQGVVAASESGVAIISRPIENIILPFVSDQYPNVRGVCYGTGYESDRKYILWLPTSANDTVARQAFVYNWITNSWTRWTKPSTAALLNPANDKLYIGGLNDITNGTNLLVERKVFSAEDYADEEYPITITNVNQFTITCNSTANLQVGDTVRQGLQGTFVIIEDIVDGTTFTADRLSAVIPGAATAYRPIPITIQTNQVAANNPGILKQFYECSFIFAETGFAVAIASFTNDHSLISKQVPIRSVKFGGWGQFNFGQQPWGGNIVGQTRIRTFVPREMMRCNWLITKLALSQAFQSLSLQGLSYIYEPMSSRQKG